MAGYFWDRLRIIKKTAGTCLYPLQYDIIKNAADTYLYPLGYYINRNIVATCLYTVRYDIIRKLLEHVCALFTMILLKYI